MRLLFWTGFWVFLADQASKYIVVHYLDLITKMRIEVFPPFLTFQMAWNRGVNFGIGAGFDMRWVLVGIAFAISAGVLVWLWRKPADRFTYISAGFLIGGAMGNVVDRFIYGAVADFLNMSCCGIENPYAFNVADVAIFIGAIGIAFADSRKPKKKRA
ncbi:MAG: signal peptidase II [Yoonia sp.]|nr:signal peptidase II [Yoonia sp.]